MTCITSEDINELHLMIDNDVMVGADDIYAAISGLLQANQVSDDVTIQNVLNCLLFETVKADSVSTTRKVLQLGANIEHIDELGQSVLHLCPYDTLNDLTMLEFLIESMEPNSIKTLLDKKDKFDETPACNIAYSGNEKAYDMICSAIHEDLHNLDLVHHMSYHLDKFHHQSRTTKLQGQTLSNALDIIRDQSYAQQVSQQEDHQMIRDLMLPYYPPAHFVRFSSQVLTASLPAPNLLQDTFCSIEHPQGSFHTTYHESACKLDSVLSSLASLQMLHQFWQKNPLKLAIEFKNPYAIKYFAEKWCQDDVTEDQQLSLAKFAYNHCTDALLKILVSEIRNSCASFYHKIGTLILGGRRNEFGFETLTEVLKSCPDTSILPIFRPLWSSLIETRRSEAPLISKKTVNGIVRCLKLLPIVIYFGGDIDIDDLLKQLYAWLSCLEIVAAPARALRHRLQGSNSHDLGNRSPSDQSRGSAVVVGLTKLLQSAGSISRCLKSAIRFCSNGLGRNPNPEILQSVSLLMHHAVDLPLMKRDVSTRNPSKFDDIGSHGEEYVLIRSNNFLSFVENKLHQTVEMFILRLCYCLHKADIRVGVLVLQYISAHISSLLVPHKAPIFNLETLVYNELLQFDLA